MAAFDGLTDLMLQDEDKRNCLNQLSCRPVWSLTPRQQCDLELLLNGGFSPLTGFMTKAQSDAVVSTMRLPTGHLWPIPINLDVSEMFAQALSVGDEIALQDQEGVTLATLEIEDIWRPDRDFIAKGVYGTLDKAHPAVNYLYEQAHPVHLGGCIKGLQLPAHYDFAALRLTPAMLRQKFQALGWKKVVAFQTRNPMHRAHFELTCRAARQHDANILIHPVSGMTKPGDVNHFTRVHCYKEIMKEYSPGLAMLSLLPMAMRMGGPREALWHAVIRRNYGCTHLIVGRDHAGPGVNSQGQPFYDPYAAQALVSQHEAELGITMVPFQEVVYVENDRSYKLGAEIKETDKVLKISGTEVRRRLAEGLEIPSWFSYPNVIKELRKTYPKKTAQGFTLFFTGLSGAGKSTLANALLTRFAEVGGRKVTLLDGDLVRHHLSSELGFSKKDRDLNVTRVGFVASEITKHSGIAICAAIAPYTQARRAARALVEPYGGFIEVFLSTSINICEQRDRKGLYKKARAGLIKGFTGIDDPYELPENPEITLDTAKLSVSDAVEMILHKLTQMGYLQGTESEKAETLDREAPSRETQAQPA